jgi:hypothetical protein
LREVQAAANALIEEAYVPAGLVEGDREEASPPIQELDLETEYAAFCEQLGSAHNTGTVAAAPPLDTSRDDDDEVPVPTEEEQARQTHINALWASKETLEQGRRDFEEREAQSARELKVNMVAEDNGEPISDDSPEAFDQRWVLRYRELTRALIEAEAAYAETKRTAFEAGVPLPFVDNETVVAMDENDDGLGYKISHEQELVASAPSPIVQQWLAKVPEGVEVGSPSFGSSERRSEADEWQAEEVEISDSRSMLAERRERLGLIGGGRFVGRSEVGYSVGLWGDGFSSQSIRCHHCFGPISGHDFACVISIALILLKVCQTANNQHQAAKVLERHSGISMVSMLSPNPMSEVFGIHGTRWYT